MTPQKEMFDWLPGIILWISVNTDYLPHLLNVVGVIMQCLYIAELAVKGKYVPAAGNTAMENS